MPVFFRGLCGLIFLALLASPGRAAERAPDPAELERVRARIAAVEQKLRLERREQDELRDRLQAAERRIADAEFALRELEEQVQAQVGQVEASQAQRALEERRLAEQRSALAQQLRATYMIGQRGKTKLLLNQDDALRVGRVLTYYDYLNRQRSARIASLMEQVASLRALHERLQAETRHLQSLREQQQGVVQALQADRAQFAQTLQRLDARIRRDARELARLQETERELGQLLGSLRDALADIPLQLGHGRPFVESRGRLPWPIKGELLASFGSPKAGGFQWNGLWIAAPEGAPVKAVARGRVAYVGWMHRYGLIIVLEHDGGYYTLYGHNQGVRTSVGEWVGAGDVIAAAGVSGGHDQAGLYFELRKGTEPVDPGRWLGRLDQR